MPTTNKDKKPAKRPKFLAKKRVLKQRPVKLKKSNSIVNERLKNNNVALAQSLNNEKEENQYLYSQNIKLTGKIQDLQGLLSERNRVLRGIATNSSAALNHLVKISEFITTIIGACQQIMGAQALNDSNQARMNASHASTRRESTRRLSGKSPARGVVQPMVSGHTITKPVINLSRINMHRIAASPTMSDIDEISEATIAFPSEPTTPVRISNNRDGEIVNRPIGRVLLPERIRPSSPRVSDETEPIQNLRRRKITDRKRKSRHSNPQSEIQNINNTRDLTIRESLPERIRISLPRIDDENVRLSDARLKRISNRKRKSKNSYRQSETFNTSNTNNRGLDLIKSPRVALQDVSRLLQNSQTLNVQTLQSGNNSLRIDDLTETSIEESDLPSSEKINDDNPEKLGKKLNSNVGTRNHVSPNDDPLEGPSWLFDNSQNISPSEENDTDLSQFPPSETNTLNLTKEIQSRTVTINLPRMSTNQFLSPGNRSNLFNSPFGGDRKNASSDNEITEDIGTLPLNRFAGVTERSQLNVYDDDDFTMMINPPSQARHQPFDINDLDLPVLESPPTNPIFHAEPEPELTRTIKPIAQLNFRPSIPAANFFDNSITDRNVSLTIPIIHEPPPNLDDSDDDESCDAGSNRKRVNYNAIYTSSESESSNSPSKSNAKSKKKNMTHASIDQSRFTLSLPITLDSAKVVLEKLSDSNKTKITHSSINLRRTSENLPSREPEIDSDASNESESRSSSRPRRQKAPMNLKEPSLHKKLRRQ